MDIIEKFRLDGKAAFVTGGARGIGKSVATAFCEAGANVAIVDLDEEEAKKTAQLLRQTTGSKTLAIKADITKPEQVNFMMNEILDAYGKLDIGKSFRQFAFILHVTAVHSRPVQTSSLMVPLHVSEAD